MIRGWVRGQRPTYSAATNGSEAVDAQVECENYSSNDQLVKGQLMAVEWHCDFAGTVPVWAESSGYFWECPRCGWEHREDGVAP